jgi:fibronectin type 3 domain-containing protein
MLNRLSARGRALKVSVLAAALAVVVVVPLAQGFPDDVPDETWGANGRVNAIVQVGNVVYLGGSFTEVREDGGAGPGALTRNYIAAFDATTGAPIDGWDPSLNGEVYALAASPDGTRIYVGGVFTTVDGLSRPRLVALEAATGAVSSSWRPKAPNGSVRALALGGGRIYAGGGFTKVGTEVRTRLAAFDATTAALDPGWQPAPDALVLTLAVSADGSRVVAGGDLTSVSGVSRGKVVALDAVTGAVDANWRPDPGQRVFGVAVKGDTVYAAVGGSINSLFAWDANTGNERWRKKSDGDFQAVAVSRGIVYAGGHFNYFEGELRRKLVAVDAATGALRRDWNPKLTATSATWYGIAALSTYGDTRLAVGGDFDTITGFRQERFAQFTGSIGGAVGDTTPPTTPTGLAATAMGGSRVELAWSASADDDGVAGYRVFRDGAQIATTSAALYTDTGVEPSRGYGYRVVAIDFAGNVSAASTAATTTTVPADEVLTFIATEDAYVDATQPDANFGSSSSLKVDASPQTDLLLKFAPAGIGERRILGAKLRLYNTDASDNGGDFRRVSDNSWSEGSVTWNTAPTGDSLVAGRLDDVAAKSWYEIDVTPAVTGDGTVSLRATSGSTNGATWSSTEGDAAARPQLVIRLAAAGAAVPRSPIFSDGFESGDLTRWSSDGGLAIRQSDPFSGAWVARATSTGQATFAYTNLRVSEPELYYQLRFKVISQGSGTVTLLKLKTGTGAQIIRLFLSTTGKLATRNDVTGVSTTSSAGVAAGRWHTAQMHVLVNDTEGKVEVWLNGVKIDALSGTASLGTTPIGRVQLGDDATGRSYDLRFDEAVTDTQAIPDRTPPTAPTGLSAAAPSAGAVDLTWEAASDDLGVTGYDIYRDGSMLATVGTATTYTDTTVSAATSYEYRVKARDAAGNTSPASEPATVTTAETDALPPSVPTLTATAVSFDRIDLSWTAATDDVGVTEYRIYRDGAPLETVGGGTRTYRDTGVASSTTHAYAVEAVDAAGNVSEASAIASATTPARTVFLDGFESGDLSQWTGGSGLVVEQGDVFAGNFAARAASTGAARYSYKQLSASHSEISYQVRFKLVSQVDSFSLLKLRTASGSALARLWLSSTGKLSTRNDVTGVSTTSSTAIAKGGWYTVRVRALVAGAAGRIDVWLNGAKVAALSKTESLGTSPTGRLQLGDEATGKTYDVVLDDVAVDAPPANTAAPTISGTALYGQTVSADPGSWSGTEPLAYAYQWRRCDATGGSCVDIAGATAQTYTLGSADVGFTLRVQVTASNTAGSASASSDPAGPVSGIPPSNMAPPEVSGTAKDGQTLTADPGSWSGSEPISYAYQWRRCDDAGTDCTDIDGATGRSYELTSADVGSTIRVQVTASNTAGSGSADSAATGTVAGTAPANSSPPTVSGTAQEGQTLAADPGVWSGTQPISYAYRWQRCGLGLCNDILGATGQSYQLTAADVGFTIRVRVTASNAIGSATSSSDPTATVSAA